MHTQYKKTKILFGFLIVALIITASLFLFLWFGLSDVGFSEPFKLINLESIQTNLIN